MAINKPQTGQQLAEHLIKSLPSYWDGKQCILELKTAEYQWKQMEWIGWWFEHKAREILAPLGATRGPKFGNMVFDCWIDRPWDFKTHPIKPGKSDFAYLNDEEAVNDCLNQHGFLGLLIAVGDADYDTSGAFKAWHDKLKGKPSAYVQQGLTIGRASRKRKHGFNLREVVWLEFKTLTELKSAIQSGWLKPGMQTGQQNSNGAPRRAKYGFSYNRWRSYGTTPPSQTGHVP